MEFYIKKQLIEVLYSLILGLIFGGLYDIIRIIHILSGIASYSGEETFSRRGAIPFAVFFATDLIYMTTVTAVYSFFIYWKMNGVFRLYVFIAVIVGFIVYYNTAGRVVMFFSEIIARFLRFIGYYGIVVPARFIFSFLFRAGRFVYMKTVGAAISYIFERILLIREKNVLRAVRKNICSGIQGDNKG